MESPAPQTDRASRARPRTDRASTRGTRDRTRPAPAPWPSPSTAPTRDPPDHLPAPPDPPDLPDLVASRRDLTVAASQACPGCWRCGGLHAILQRYVPL